MTRSGFREFTPSRVAILRALKVGDLLCAVPVLRAMRRAWPQADVALIGLPWARGFCERFHAYVDTFIEFPGYPGVPEREFDPPAIERFLDDMRSAHYDLAVQLHGSGSIVNDIVAQFGSRTSAGFFEPGDLVPDERFFIPYPREGLEKRRLLQLTRHLGIVDDGEHLEFPLTDDENAWADGWLLSQGLEPRRFACIHPGASVAERQWRVDGFASVAALLQAQRLDVVLTGSASERRLTANIARAVPGCIDMAGQTDLGTLGAIVSRSRILVANDTGVSHIADGLGVPSVILSTGDNPARWAPADARRHRVLARPGGVHVIDVCQATLRLLEDTRHTIAKEATCVSAS